MNNVTQYAPHIELAIRSAARKHSLRLRGTVREELRQECYLALLKAPESCDFRTVIRNRITDVLRTERLIGRKNRRRWFEPASLSDPQIQRELAEQQYTESFDAKLDAERLLDLLPWPEDEILRHAFGIGTEKKTEREIARLLQQTQVWVHRRKQAALRQLQKVAATKEKP